MRWLRSHLSGRRSVLQLAIALGVTVLLLGGSYVAGVHQHHFSEGATHCAVCSFAGVHVAPTTPAPLASAPMPRRLSVPRSSVRLAQRLAISSVASRAPPAA